MKLTGEQVRFFRHTGYLKLPEVVPRGEVGAMRAVIQRHANERIPPLRVDPQDRVTHLDGAFDRDAVFRRVFCSDAILDPLESLLGPNIELVLNRHNHATINAPGATPFRLHRDILQWTRAIVSVIVYLEETSVANGCTHLIPGSQYLPFVGTPNNGGTWMDEHGVYASLMGQAIPVPMDVGGVLFFDSLLFHTVGANLSDVTRMSVCMGFHSVDELAGNRDDPKRRLVRGERVYKGNDR